MVGALLREFKQTFSKVLIFSYSTKMLDVLSNYLTLKGYSFVRLDGNTQEADRQKLVDDFNSLGGVEIFIISTKAGGVGLNLVAANKVIIFDPNWNPAHDQQARPGEGRSGSLL